MPTLHKLKDKFRIYGKGELSQCRKSTDTRRIIPLVTPFVLVLLGDADHERAGGNFKYLIVI